MHAWFRMSWVTCDGGPKTVLHSPVSDFLVLSGRVEQWLSQRASLIAIFGEGCEALEDHVDALNFGSGTAKDRSILTSRHKDEAVIDALEFVTCFNGRDQGEIIQVKI